MKGQSWAISSTNNLMKCFSCGRFQLIFHQASLCVRCMLDEDQVAVPVTVGEIRSVVEPGHDLWEAAVELSHYWIKKAGHSFFSPCSCRNCISSLSFSPCLPTDAVHAFSLQGAELVKTEPNIITGVQCLSLKVRPLSAIPLRWMRTPCTQFILEEQQRTTESRRKGRM